MLETSLAAGVLLSVDDDEVDDALLVMGVADSDEDD